MGFGTAVRGVSTTSADVASHCLNDARASLLDFY